jgi:hypothetical protein
MQKPSSALAEKGASPFALQRLNYRINSSKKEEILVELMEAMR